MTAPTRIAVLLGVTSLLVYSVNLREISSQDTIPARVLPVELLRAGRLDLDRYFRDAQPDAALPYWVQKAGGHYVSSYPVAPALVATPIYALPILLSGSDAWALVNGLAKLSASLLAALSVAFVYLGARTLASANAGGRSAALGATLVYAFATSTWSVSSQGLWGHAPAQLALSAAIYWLARADGASWRFGAAGLATGVMLACRPPAAPLAAALTFFVLRERPRRGTAWFLLLGGLVGLAVLVHNVATFGSPQGGYAEINRTHAQYHGVASTWSTGLVGGLLGLLVSPSRGLLVYSPVLAFALVGLVSAVRAPRGSPYPYLAGGAGGTLVMLGAYSVWWGGHSFGPRLAGDVLPALVLCLIPVWGRLWAGPAGRAALAALFVWSVGVQAVGAFYYPSPRATDWNTSPRDVDQAHERLWDWRDPQLLRLLRNGPRSPGFRDGP